MDITETIISAGRARKLIQMNYSKKTTEEIKTYLIEPYKIEDNIFWGFSIEGNHIGKFYIHRINSIEMLEQTYEPQWPIEF